ncbi:hypothetical protein COCOBI_05-2070 [Coccomyxa sp. Obi]|nr:hypothetical protein COCOBI_05-2070 [Coccomyxa sp. Obi]
MAGLGEGQPLSGANEHELLSSIHFQNEATSSAAGKTQRQDDGASPSVAASFVRAAQVPCPCVFELLHFRTKEAAYCDGW